MYECDESDKSSDDSCDESDLYEQESKEQLIARISSLRSEIEKLNAKLFVVTDQLIHFRKFFAHPELSLLPLDQRSSVSKSLLSKLKKQIHLKQSPKLSRYQSHSLKRLWTLICSDISVRIFSKRHRVHINRTFIFQFYFIIIHLALFWYMFIK